MNATAVLLEQATCDSMTVTTDGLMKLLQVGRHTAIDIGLEAGAEIKIGRLRRWNTKKVQEYLDKISE